MSRLEGRIAIVTGAAQGIGLETAALFAREGARIVLVDRQGDGIKAAAETIGPAASAITADVTDKEAWIRLISSVEVQHGGLDILVNNAAIMDVDTPEIATLDDALRMWRVNVGGVILGCKYAIPLMRQRGGAIVNVASLASIQGSPMASSYSASKGGVEAYTRSVAVYCRQSGWSIRCNSVHPAAVDTPMNQLVASKIAAKNLQATGGQIRSSGRELAAIDLANAILFLAADESRFITGQALIVDDGASITAGSAPGAGSGK